MANFGQQRPTLTTLDVICPIGYLVRDFTYIFFKHIFYYSNIVFILKQKENAR